ncbi:hypothetical protein HCN44_005940 [Aphidius gifuensis]|uniref:NR LBD domain-containing protein n=1 Tax=Aphidius gifuensis TaxID=684658 RepID=A0A834XXX3_APHGI|nr:hypothetical protein HCN44_005940 [Aphidius gifuensis]
MADNVEILKEAFLRTEDGKPQRLLLFEQLVKKAEDSIPEVDDFLSKVNIIFDLRQLNMKVLKWDKFLEVWVCLISPRMTKENSLVFEDGTCFTRQQLELIYGIDFVNAFVSFLLSLQRFSEIELKLLTTFVVLSRTIPDAYYVCKSDIFDNNRAVQKLKDFCAGFFDFDISEKLIKLPELVEQHNNVVKWFSKNYYPFIDISKNMAKRLKFESPLEMSIKSESRADLEGPLPSPEIVEAKKIDLWKELSTGPLLFYMQTQISSAHACVKSLTKKDQACLLKHGLIEGWFCEISRYITRNLIVLRPTLYLRKHIELMYGPDFADAFIETLLSLQAYQLSTLEMKLFKEIVLLNQRPGLVDVEAVQKLQDLAIEKFSAERLKNQTNNVDIPTLDISQMLSKLQALSLLHSNSLDWLKENSSKVSLPDFLCELFDIPNFISKKV